MCLHESCFDYCYPATASLPGHDLIVCVVWYQGFSSVAGTYGSDIYSLSMKLSSVEIHYTLFFLTFSQFSLSLLSDSVVINTMWQILHMLKCHLVPVHRDSRSFGTSCHSHSQAWLLYRA